MGVIIIAVFWLLGLLMAWSMCVVAARADRRMEEIRHTHAAPVAGLSIMMLGVPLLILARRHRHGHANPPV